MTPEWLQQVNQELDAADPQTRVEIIRGLEIRRKRSLFPGKRGIPILSLFYYANPDRDPETPAGKQWFEKARGNYSSQGKWDREQEIDDNAGGGELLLAPMLSQFKDQIIITDPAWLPDPRWESVCGFDHGVTNATAMARAYLDFNGDIYFAGEYYSYRRDGWDNSVGQNAAYLNDLYYKVHPLKPRWCMADPSIFDQNSVSQRDGSFSNLDRIYRENGVKFLQRYDGDRNDLTFIERLNEHWAGLRIGDKPSLYIVCREQLQKDTRQPGLHPYDCPNLLWEFKRTKRAQLTATQLMTRNPTENVVDRDNHIRDAAKYACMMLPRPTAKPLENRYQETKQQVEESTGRPLTPMSDAILQTRFLGMERTRSGRGAVNLKNKGQIRWR